MSSEGEVSEEAWRLLVALRGIEQELRAQNCPLVDQFEPGLSRAEFDRLTRDAGISLNEVTRTLFTWHNGSMTASPPPNAHLRSEEGEMPSGFRFYSLEYLLDYWKGSWLEQCREIAEGSDADDEYGEWGPSWFPLLIDSQENRHCVIALPQDERGDELVLAELPYGIRQFAARLPSVTSLFEFLLIWLRTRVISWDADTKSWAYADDVSRSTLRVTWWW